MSMTKHMGCSADLSAKRPAPSNLCSVHTNVSLNVRQCATDPEDPKQTTSRDRAERNQRRRAIIRDDPAPALALSLRAAGAPDDPERLVGHGWTPTTEGRSYLIGPVLNLHTFLIYILL